MGGGSMQTGSLVWSMSHVRTRAPTDSLFLLPSVLRGVPSIPPSCLCSYNAYDTKANCCVIGAVAEPHTCRTQRMPSTSIRVAMSQATTKLTSTTMARRASSFFLDAAFFVIVHAARSCGRMGRAVAVDHQSWSCAACGVRCAPNMVQGLPTDQLIAVRPRDDEKALQEWLVQAYIAELHT
jgi:hypothetical protein